MTLQIITEEQYSMLLKDYVGACREIDRLRAINTELVKALEGDDPEMLPSIQPLGWLYTAIHELKEPGAVARVWEEDPDAMQTMILELEWIYEKGRSALAKARGER